MARRILSVGSEPFSGMDALEAYYDKQTFTLYALFAWVPNKKVWRRKLFVAIGVILLLLSTTFQALKLLMEGVSLQVIIELLPTAMPSAGSLFYILYVAYGTKENYEAVLIDMLSDLRETRTEEEKAIKRKYARGARMFIRAYTTVFVMVMCGVPLSVFTPVILDTIVPLNESREKQLLFNGEFFVDQRKYFYEIYFLECCALVVVCVLIGVSENMSVIVGQHVCGMLAIIGHQLENVTRVNAGRRRLLDNVDYGHLVTRRIKLCIQGHQRALRVAVLIARLYDIPATVTLIVTFFSLTVSLVQVTDPQFVSLKMVFFTITQIFQFFILSAICQIAIDKSEQMAEHAYNSKWHLCPPNARRLLQLVLLRSSKPCKVVARSMYTLSIENFMTVIQTVTSCYMVLRQAQ